MCTCTKMFRFRVEFYVLFIKFYKTLRKIYWQNCRFWPKIGKVGQENATRKRSRAVSTAFLPSGGPCVAQVRQRFCGAEDSALPDCVLFVI